MSGPLLAASGLDVSYGGKSAAASVLSDLSLSVAHGEAVGIVGESGSGKTTLAKVILGLVPPRAGKILFEGVELTSLGPAARREFRRSGAIQYVFQDPLGSLDPYWAVSRSIEEPLLLQGMRDVERRRQAVLRTADLVGLKPELLHRLPGELSGGQRQRVAIARALVSNPKLLIADEPVSALDASSRVQILELFVALRQSLGIAQLFISHDLGSVIALVDRVVVLYRGRIVEAGPPAEILGNPTHDYTRRLIEAAPSLRI